MPPGGPLPRAGLWQICIGFAALWLVLDRSAALLGSYRGEYGLLVCLVVLVAAAGVEQLLGRTPLRLSLENLGLRAPAARGLLWSALLCAAMLGFYPLFALATGTPIGIRADWWMLLPGLFAQGGIAEELVFRGFLFRHVRNGRSFRAAALISAVPFVSVHLLLFLSMDFALALAALFVAVSISFPLAWLFERSGNSIWPCALVHCVVQGSIKLVEVPAEQFMPVAACWMVLGTLAPWLLFVVLRREK